MKTLGEWNQWFASELNAKCPTDSRCRAGAMLSVIPERQAWNAFLSVVREGRWLWTSSPNQFPHALLLLYGGLAFYEYDDNTFWPAFCRCLGLPSLPANQQTAWNGAFGRAAKLSGFPVLERSGHRFFVGTAVCLAGIPLSMWEGFLGVCEWALWHRNWHGLPDPDWAEAMNRRLGGHTRLIRFLTENRETASSFVREMLAARQILCADKDAKISTLAQASLLRREYFEEVPETADFLRPHDPDSLLDDRPRLVWREPQRRVAVHLPPIPGIVGEWECLGHQALATDVATELALNGRAFEAELPVKLASEGQVCAVQLAGLQPFSLLDEQRQRFANLKRTRLSPSAYRLFSREPLRIQATGWAEFEENEQLELEDGTQCFITCLWPASDRPQLTINGGQTLHFGRRERVNLRVYSGSECSHVLRFGWKQDTLHVERLPQLVLEIPLGFLGEDDICDEEMREEFVVLVNGQPKSGRWVCFHQYPTASPEVDYYEWKWDQPKAPQGDYELKVRSTRTGELPFGTRRSQFIRIGPPTEDVLWPRPAQLGKFWAWTLLAQIQDESTWEEFWIARQAVAGFQDVRINQNDWKKLEEHGYVRLRRGFAIQKCAIFFMASVGNETLARFAGLPNRLYSLIREVRPLRPLKVVEERGLPPCLEIAWPACDRQYLRSICPREGITVVDRLWNR